MRPAVIYRNMDWLDDVEFCGEFVWKVRGIGRSFGIFADLRDRRMARWLNLQANRLIPCNDRLINRELARLHPQAAPRTRAAIERRLHPST